MKKSKLSVLVSMVLLPSVLLAQMGPGLGNLTYTQNELNKGIWTYTEVNHYGSTMATMQNGYMITTFHPDSGKPPGGILVWDVSNPRKPLQVARIYNNQTSTFREQHALPQHDKYIIMQDGFGFQIWDFSNPKSPVQTKRHIMSGYAHDDYGSCWQIFWQAPYIYIANGSKGFDVVDATNINSPVLVKHITAPRQVGSIFAIGNLLYTSAHDFGKGFTIYDISNPRDPKLLNSYANTENMYASTVNGNKMIISARGNTNNAVFGTYDVSDPVNIKKLTTLNIGNSAEQLYCSTQDEYIFQGCQYEIVKIDASNITSQRVVGRGSVVTTNPDHGQVTPFGNLIFAGNDHGSGSGLFVHQMAPDKKAPMVNMVVPKSNDVNRALTSRVGITLTDNILYETINRNTFIVRPVGGEALAGKYSHQTSMVNFSPDQPLLANTTYEIVVPAGGMKDYAGNPTTTTFTSYFSTGPTITKPIVEQKPFKTAPHAIPGRIQAEEYDLGGEGLAYHETDAAGNQGGATFRTDEVDIENCTDQGGGYNIGYALQDEWLEYTVNVTASKTYGLDLRLAAEGEGKTMHIEVDGVDVTGAIGVPNTGGWQTWQTAYVKDIFLSKGAHMVRVVFDADYVNVNYLDFREVITTGLDHLEVLGLSVYPNPFSSGMHLKGKVDYTYSITDIEGTVLETGQGIGEQLIGTQLKAGIYLLSVKTNEGVMNQKIVKH